MPEATLPDGKPESAATIAGPADHAAIARAWWLGVALVLASAWWCTGFIHGDEHFQVLEFANARLGRSPVADLPWEYAARARSWILPAIAAGVRWLAARLGADDPFRIAFVLRLASGVLYLAAARRLARVSRPWFRSAALWRWAVFAGVAMWFVPVVTARLSSESWSGSLFFLGLATVIRLERDEPVSAWERWLAGAAFGLAFVVRFQVLIPELGAVAWLARSRARSGARLSTWVPPLVFGGLAMVLASAVLDRWGYGAWSFPLWNYYRAELVEGVLESYGTSPWWWYAPDIVHKAGVPIGLLLLGGFAVVCVRRPSSVLVWVGVPFVAFHVLIGNKETRFLFPLVAAAPYFAFLAMDALKWPGPSRTWRVTLAGVALAANAVPFVMRLSIPMEPRVPVAQAIARSGVNRVFVAGAANPYVWWGLRAHWYDTPGVAVTLVNDAADAARQAAAAGGALVVTRAPTEPDTTGGTCRIIHRSAGLTILAGRRWFAGAFLPEREQEPGWWIVSRCGAPAGN